MDALLTALRAAAEPTRLRLLALAARGAFCVMDFTDILGQSQPRLSRHLKLLKDAGLVTEEPRGTRRIYRLHDEGVAAVQAYLVQVWGEAAARFSLAAENTRQRP